MATHDARNTDRNTDTRAARILVVDDSAIARAVIGRGLKAAGMRVDEARGGAEALELLSTADYDVVISDLCMPGVDGFALLARIKTQTPAPEVIILSGLQDVDRAMQALKLGAHAYLPKPPAHPEEVLLTVRRALETKRLRDLCTQLQQKLANAEEGGARAMSPPRASQPTGVAAG